MFKDFTFKRTRGSGAILNTGDEMQIRYAAEIIPAHIVEATQYKTAYIVKYRPVGREITCIASVLPGITNLPAIYGPPRNYDIYWSTAYMYYKDPQDKKRVHIWPCPISVKKGWLSTDENIYQLAQQRIDHIVELQQIQNSMLTLVPGTDTEVYLHKQWWR